MYNDVFEIISARDYEYCKKILGDLVRDKLEGKPITIDADFNEKKTFDYSLKVITHSIRNSSSVADFTSNEENCYKYLISYIYKQTRPSKI